MKPTTEQENQIPLSSGQQRFIDAYIETLDAVKSATIAGYSKNNIKTRAKELLQSPRIQRKIHEKLEQFPAMLKVNKAFIVKKLFEIINAASAQEQGESRQSTIKLKDSAIVLRALDALSRCFEMTSEVISPQNEDLHVLCIENLDETKL